MDQIEDINIKSVSPEFSAPLGKITLSTDNLNALSDSLSIREGEENVLEFFYFEELIDAPVYERFFINRQNFENSFPFSSFAFV